MIHRHIARFNVVDTDFSVQVTSGAVSRASLNADQVTRLQLLTCGHIDLRQMPKVHIVVRAPHPKHNALTKTLFGERCTLPSSANNRTVYRRVNVLVSDAHEVIALVICAIRPQMPIRLRYSESVLIRGNQNQSTSISNKKAMLTISTASLNTL